jgi:SAM-dependent methyltransferase
LSAWADDRERRAQSFASVADVYERARPGYPEDAVRWLSGDVPCDVVDLAAGTGKLTRTLVALGHRVTAVEPLPEMLAHLRDALPEVTSIEGNAELIPLPGESADVVTVAQAFHWFEPEPALREIARVLRPGGRIALVWNTRDDREPWVAELSAAVTGREGIEMHDYEAALAASGPFDPAERETFSLAQRLDRTGLRELALSRSYCAVMEPEGREQVLDAIDRVYESHAGVDGIDLPYRTECFRAARR